MVHGSAEFQARFCILLRSVQYACIVMYREHWKLMYRDDALTAFLLDTSLTDS